MKNLKIKLVLPVRAVVTIEKSRPEEDVISLAKVLVTSIYGDLNWKFDVSEGDNYIFVAKE